MTPAQDPFYIVKDEIQDSIDNVQDTFHQWKQTPENTGEYAYLTKELLTSCESIQWQERGGAGSEQPGGYARGPPWRSWGQEWRGPAELLRSHVRPPGPVGGGFALGRAVPVLAGATPAAVSRGARWRGSLHPGLRDLPRGLRSARRPSGPVRQQFEHPAPDPVGTGGAKACSARGGSDLQGRALLVLWVVVCWTTSPHASLGRWGFGTSADGERRQSHPSITASCSRPWTTTAAQRPSRCWALPRRQQLSKKQSYVMSMNWRRQSQLLREIQHTMDLMRLKLGEEEAGLALHATRCSL